MNKLLKRNVLGMPIIYSLVILGILLTCIIVGSFKDFDISTALFNKTTIGEHFSTYGSIISFCLYPAAGMCLFKAIKKRGKNLTFLAWIILIASFFLAVYYSENYNGFKLRSALGDFPAAWFVSCLIWILIYAWVPIVCYFIIDDSHPERLIAIGVTIIIADVVSDCLNLWLKELASRPRYGYLITLDNPLATFRNWWQWNPYYASTVKEIAQDNFRSWPSGNMTIATITCTLPLLISNVKKSNKIMVNIAFAFACAYVILYGYNRIHMGKHFLTDVSFGVLFTYIIFALVDQGFEIAFNKSKK